ncbi:acyl-CoA dehydratase activase [Bacteroidales bacterium OttesenSCG-928-M11]|nr:acyl-CoA dehydratase activase [Bacteroidales bacterium OttesenSCG-928-M11]
MGIDIGSTTIKVIILDESFTPVYQVYKRHKTDIRGAFALQLQELEKKFGNHSFRVCFTGTAGMGVAERTGLPFVQEVVAAVELVRRGYTETRTLLDLGGEDAKIVFFKNSNQPEIRMNGSCAGGTGAFIDQMASLMNVSLDEFCSKAKQYEKIYPIASRCGVFAKTDIQNLISKNVPIADIAASTLHAVAMQNITSLARGYDVETPVLCIGGPLSFIPELRKAFAKVLQLDEKDFILPPNSEYFPAWGAALNEGDGKTYTIKEIEQRQNQNRGARVDVLPVLFNNEEEYKKWNRERKIKPLRFRSLDKSRPIENCFLGIDSGSTTTKIVIADKDYTILYRFYSTNEGNALKKVVEGLERFYKEAETAGVDVRICASAVTGYGEDLIRSALNLDYGIVETMAHLKGAQFVDPNVSFVLDIGGQDIKSIFIENGVISNIELNEACSSGCGSFLQNFAETVNLSLDEFSQSACLAKQPCDLGSRCTVFMNSKVKQALRENAEVSDIASGLAYSVVKNCLFKVLNISNLNRLGNHIVVQGGTFKNDAVFRAMELLAEKEIGATDCPELMGAFGSAIYASEKWEQNGSEISSFSSEQLTNLLTTIQTSEIQCKGCTNTCSILRFKFPNGNISYAGNKCEKVFYGTGKSKKKGYNAFERKNEILFLKSTSLGKQRIGIPRVLNMFESFPFWEALFSACGLEVELSPESTYKLFQSGISTIMSDNICFPAKLVHGHVLSLIETKVDRIFYPIIPKENKEFAKSNNSYNCPVVSGYPDVIRSSIDPENKYHIPFDTPVIGFNDKKVLKASCWQYFESLGVERYLFTKAFDFALKKQNEVKERLINEQKELFDKVVIAGQAVFVIAGRPYHTDPLIHQKTGQILADLGAYVFTDDVFRKENEAGYDRLNIVSQWSYPNRVVQSALQVAKYPDNVQLIQLNSFGCGPDSFYMDEASAILKQAGKNLTVVRIDEIASPGSVRLRLRSLVESLKTRQQTELKNTFSLSEKGEIYHGHTIPFTKKDKKKTILVPWLCDFLNPFIPAIGELTGYNLVNLPKSNRASVDTGLKYGHNEVCYPSTLVLGDIINGLQSGKYDLDNVAVAITQTGGQCRATNYIAQIKMGLKRAGFENIPVVALTSGKTYQNNQEGFSIPWLKLANIAVYLVLYGDALQQMYSAISPREKKSGDAQRIFDFYIQQGSEAIRKKDHKLLLKLLQEAVDDFNNISIYDRSFSKIGLVGEIFVKYNNYAQANITQWLRENKMEVVTPPILDFIMQYFVNSKVNYDNGVKRGGRFQEIIKPVLWKYMNKRISQVENIMQGFNFYHPSESIYLKAEYASQVLSLSNQFGEGWLLSAEIVCFVRRGINRVVCIQPFGCIANHVVAKGIEKRIKKLYPDVNLLYLDVDGGVGEVNLQNRLHFMISE